MLGYSGTITFPETLEYIGRRAFAVSSFSSINIPAKVSHLGTSPFGTNSNLKTITIDPQNKYYIVTSDNSIYNYMKTVLIQAPTNLDNLNLEPTLVEIGYCAIESCQMTELLFPVTFSRMLENESIQSCHNLKTIYFLGNLIKIASDAIYNCENLQNIYYYGTVTVNIKFFTSNRDDMNIRLCNGYKGNSFATLLNFTKDGPCPDVNYIKQITVVRKTHRLSLIPITLFVINK